MAHSFIKSMICQEMYKMENLAKNDKDCNVENMKKGEM